MTANDLRHLRRAGWSEEQIARNLAVTAGLEDWIGRLKLCDQGATAILPSNSIELLENARDEIVRLIREVARASA